jgi:hypothetical protein
MKKAYKPKKKSKSFKIKKSKYYNAFALVIDGMESAWGDMDSMKSRLREAVKKNKA